MDKHEKALLEQIAAGQVLSLAILQELYTQSFSHISCRDRTPDAVKEIARHQGRILDLLQKSRTEGD